MRAEVRSHSSRETAAALAGPAGSRAPRASQRGVRRRARSLCRPREGGDQAVTGRDGRSAESLISLARGFPGVVDHLEEVVDAGEAEELLNMARSPDDREAQTSRSRVQLRDEDRGEPGG